MARFKNAYDSHAHSLKVLNLLREYDSFLDSLSIVVDMGCGHGLDTRWWATLESRDEPPQPYNYLVYAVDNNINQLDSEIASLSNVVHINGNFEIRVVPRDVDLIWAHDVLQYATDPLKCLRAWRSTLVDNGMLLVSVPQSTWWNYSRGRLVTEVYNHNYFNYNLLTLMYMLAMSGFDCRDAYFYREKGTPWLYAAVYASPEGALPQGSSWYDLAERQMINDSVISSLDRYGYVRQEDILVTWLDKENYLVSD